MKTVKEAARTAAAIATTTTGVQCRRRLSGGRSLTLKSSTALTNRKNKIPAKLQLQRGTPFDC